MNKFLVSSNVLLIIAVIILFVLFFKNQSSVQSSPAAQSGNVDTLHPSFKIGYFELDSLDNNYKYELDVKEQLMASDKKLENQINDLQNEIRDRYAQIQKKGPNMSQAEQIQYSNELDQLTKSNQAKAQRLQQSMAIERDSKIRQVKKTVQNYLKTFAKENGYNYIWGTNEDDYLYYKDSAQDITKDLVQKLNQLYADSLKNIKK